MEKNMKREKTRKALTDYYRSYPHLEVQDLFKFIYQSSFGCEHLIGDGAPILEYIEKEYATLRAISPSDVEELDGEYSRVNLSAISRGLSSKTLAGIFKLSAKREERGLDALAERLDALRELAISGEIPLDPTDLASGIANWKRAGYPPIHHSERYRQEYSPAYRVVAKRYCEYIGVFREIDRLIAQGSATVVIEGGSASGKSTLADILAEVYDCNVFHMDDFFLRPEQRTPQRLGEVGGNVDRERFYSEVVSALLEGRAVEYRRFNCSDGTLGEPICVLPKPLNVVEGVYSMHPGLGRYYDFAIFLDITPQYQRARILKRNTGWLAERFFNEWIPLESAYFDSFDIKASSNMVIPVKE